MWIKKNALRDKNGEGCGGWPTDATCLNNWCLQLFFLQRSVLIWIKLKITYVIKCEELRIVAANLARYRPNWIFDVFISMKSVKLLLFSFIEWISNLLFFCVIELCVILNCLNHISQTWNVSKTCVCGGGGGASSTSISLPCHENIGHENINREKKLISPICFEPRGFGV